jgi:hypothetical protein
MPLGSVSTSFFRNGRKTRRSVRRIIRPRLVMPVRGRLGRSPCAAPSSDANPLSESGRHEPEGNVPPSAVGQYRPRPLDKAGDAEDSDEQGGRCPPPSQCPARRPIPSHVMSVGTTSLGQPPRDGPPGQSPLASGRVWPASRVRSITVVGRSPSSRWSWRATSGARRSWSRVGAAMPQAYRPAGPGEGGDGARSRRLSPPAVPSASHGTRPASGCCRSTRGRRRWW